MKEKSYLEHLKDPRWQKKRLEIMQRDQFRCRECGDGTSELNVHHKIYIENKKPWEYPDLLLVTLCNPCHKKIHSMMSNINSALGLMTSRQLYFTSDIINMLLLANEKKCLETLEFLTSSLREVYHV